MIGHLFLLPSLSPPRSSSPSALKQTPLEGTAEPAFAFPGRRVGSVPSPCPGPTVQNVGEAPLSAKGWEGTRAEGLPVPPSLPPSFPPFGKERRAAHDRGDQ